MSMQCVWVGVGVGGGGGVLCYRRGVLCVMVNVQYGL